MIGRPTQRGGIAQMFVVDADFAEEVGKHSWCNDGGYLCARVGGKRVLLHRFVWQIKHGSVPPMLDHINRVRWDCRLENLRPASHSLNNRNTARLRTKHDLPRGVQRVPGFRTSPYAARIRDNGKIRHIGYFPTPELASAAYEEAHARAISHEERNHR